MRFQVRCLVLLGLLVAQGTGKDCPHRKAATLLPSFTVTPTTTESTASPTTSHGNVTVHPTSNSTSSRPATSTHNPAMTTSHGNATVYPTTDNGTATSPGVTTGPHPGPPPPSPSPSPGSKGVLGNYTWTNGSRPCVQLQAQIQIRILYPTRGGGKAWGISVLNPNKTKVQGGCDSAYSHLPLSFPYGQLTFGFKQDLEQSIVYLNYMAVEYNVSFPQAAQWTFSAQNSSLRELQAPLGQSFCCRNTSIVLSPAAHLDLLSLRLQAAQLPNTGHLGPCFSCTSDQSLLLPLVIGLVLLGLLTLVLIAFCITRRRQSPYQPL
ncbi:macrosialin [Peromyscus eremicus]|uniref:macrosialin n=1 Tax=Peromyscus eremicus TaxID=42410 RepID=UPI0027DDE3D9|nr:macrosialin [Peromyscus eremicus]